MRRRMSGKPLWILLSILIDKRKTKTVIEQANNTTKVYKDDIGALKNTAYEQGREAREGLHLHRLSSHSLICNLKREQQNIANKCHSKIVNWETKNSEIYSTERTTNHEISELKKSNKWFLVVKLMED